MLRYFNDGQKSWDFLRVNRPGFVHTLDAFKGEPTYTGTKAESYCVLKKLSMTHGILRVRQECFLSLTSIIADYECKFGCEIFKVSSKWFFGDWSKYVASVNNHIDKRILFMVDETGGGKSTWLYEFYKSVKSITHQPFTFNHIPTHFQIFNKSHSLGPFIKIMNHIYHLTRSVDSLLIVHLIWILTICSFSKFNNNRHREHNKITFRMP